MYVKAKATLMLANAEGISDLTFVIKVFMDKVLYTVRAVSELLKWEEGCLISYLVT